MKPLYRRLLIFVIVVLILLGGYAVYWFSAAREARSVPRDFSEARTRGALISQEIVANSGEVAGAISQLSGTTSTLAQASSTLGGILDGVEEIRLQAIQLAGELEKMTRALPEVESEPARDAALNSISQRLSLVSSLVQYTSKVKQLVAELRLRLANEAQNAQEINELVEEINAEVTAINTFNREANGSMERFDELLR